jgi:large subunit ribosomal protein L29
MKRSEAKKDLHAKDAAGLKAELDALLKEQFGLRMQKATQQLSNTAKIRDVRRAIARTRTLMTQKASAQKASAQKAGQ